MQRLRSIYRGALIFTLFSVILLTAAQVRADITQYGSRTDFQQAVKTYVIEDWDEFTGATIDKSGAVTNSGKTFYDGETVNGITYNYIPYKFPAGVNYPDRTFDSFMVVSFGSSTGKNTLGLTATDGSGDMAGGPDYFTYDGVKFTFSQRIRSFGIDISTEATENGVFMATITTSTGNKEYAYSVNDPFFTDAYGNEWGQFLGFTSDEPFTSVSITYNLDSSGITYEGYAYGWTLDTMQVPLPPSLLLLGSGLAGLGLLRFRKRFKA